MMCSTIWISWDTFLLGHFLPFIPFAPTPTQGSITTFLESKNHLLPGFPNFTIFPLNPLPWPHRASWNLFPLCYFRKKQCSGGEDNNSNSVINIYWAVLYTQLCSLFWCYLIESSKRLTHMFEYEPRFMGKDLRLKQVGCFVGDDTAAFNCHSSSHTVRVKCAAFQPSAESTPILLT